MIGAMIGLTVVTLVNFFEDEVEILGVDEVPVKTLNFWTTTKHIHLMNAPIIIPILTNETWS